jgi:putative copper resistance protein D
VSQAIGVLARGLHLAACLQLVGCLAAVLLAGPAGKPTGAAWQARMLGWARRLALAAPLTGLALLAQQVAHVTGRPGAVLEPGSWLTVLGQTRFGTVWLLRHGLLVLIAALLLLAERERSRADWFALRGQGLLLGAAALAAMAWAGHAAAADPVGLPAPWIDAPHRVAAGAWLGGLLPVALLLRATATEGGADSRPYAIVAVRRFSTLALAAMAVLVLTGLAHAWTQLADVGALLGTPYGWLLLTKLGLLVPILLLGALNRRRLLPRLGGPGPTVGRPAMLRLGGQVAAECALGLAIVGVVSLLATTPPGRHDVPVWPLSWRLDWAATAALPGVRIRVLAGSQVAVLGAVLVLAAALARRWLGAGLAGGGALVAGGLALALPAMAVDAYPTTYRRSTVPYQALSVARGQALYATHCLACHGAAGTGDGPGAAGLPRRPADLTAPHTNDHTAGDLFWWLTHGIPAGGMPGFGSLLAEDDRWDLINFLRALAAAAEARTLAPVIEPERPRVVAPDAVFSIGPGPPVTLKDFRGRRAVVLVLFSLPASRERLVQLAQSYELLRGLGAELIGVPLDGDEGVLSRIGATNPPLLYPVVLEGAAEIAAAYGLFRRTLSDDGPGPAPPVHVEFLIDRSGYLRARWIPDAAGRGWANPTLLAAEIQQLAREAPAPPPAEHVH